MDITVELKTDGEMRVTVDDIDLHIPPTEITEKINAVKASIVGDDDPNESRIAQANALDHDQYIYVKGLCRLLSKSLVTFARGGHWINGGTQYRMYGDTHTAASVQMAIDRLKLADELHNDKSPLAAEIDEWRGVIDAGTSSDDQLKEVTAQWHAVCRERDELQKKCKVLGEELQTFEAEAKKDQSEIERLKMFVGTEKPYGVGRAEAFDLMRWAKDNVETIEILDQYTASPVDKGGVTLEVTSKNCSCKELFLPGGGTRSRSAGQSFEHCLRMVREEEKHH